MNSLPHWLLFVLRLGLQTLLCGLIDLFVTSGAYCNDEDFKNTLIDPVDDPGVSNPDTSASRQAAPKRGSQFVRLSIFNPFGNNLQDS